MTSASGARFHLYYRAPRKPVLRNSIGRLGPHIVTRGNGGYVLIGTPLSPCCRPRGRRAQSIPQLSTHWRRRHSSTLQPRHTRDA
ncbi:bifunctional DNA primase/polymerase [Nocardia sp. NPDC049526]|uniref:bifunctional DNA primase/polymerase n=1 Tax=Nocardia sp. NPDC049526 TaxID=3364316 RepID=UPI00379F2100